MIRDFIYDIESYPNIFTLAVEHADSGIQWMFEISDWVNDSQEIIQFLSWLNFNNSRMVGFNNVGFDYPILHKLVKMGYSDAITLYDYMKGIIDSQNYYDDKWKYQVYPSDRFVEQLDLFKIHHFDNKSKSTSLKALEFTMRSDNIKDLPYPVGKVLTYAQSMVLKTYNKHDVDQTKLFYYKSLDMIKFREKLTARYNKDFMNHSDVKIGNDFVIMKLEQAGVQCYTYNGSLTCNKGTKGPIQTLRFPLALNDCIFPWITFDTPAFNQIRDWLKQQVINETEGVFKKLIVTVNGFDFSFGLGGIHGSVKNRVINSEKGYVIQDLDVMSYYPSVAIANKLKPEHLGNRFCTVYEDLKKQRIRYKKGTPENAMLKLALNGVYGNSNNVFSVFYDTKFTMSVTLNGQLLLCLLAEKLMTIKGLSLIQANTDGLTIRFRKSDQKRVTKVYNDWENLTSLQLESKFYQKMFIRDVNNYLAVHEDGIKRKGAYNFELDWHQNASALVVPKVAEQVLLNNTPIREAVMNHTDVMDFMLRAKVSKTSKLVLVDSDGVDTQVQNTTRYYVAKNGRNLVKIMPPLTKKVTEGDNTWRRFNIVSGWGVQVCNDIKDRDLEIDYEYYIQEVEKLTLALA